MIWRDGEGARPWRCRVYDVDGQRVQKSFPTKKLADEFERQWLTDKARERSGLAPQKPNVLFCELAQLYLDGYSARSKPWFEEMLSYSLARWGDVRIRSIEPEMVQKWLVGLSLAPKTKQHILAVLRQVFNSSVEWNYLDRSPVRPTAVRLPKVGHTDNIKPFESWEEVVRVADAAGEKWSPLIRFACATGLRPQEWLAVRWQDIASNEVQVQQFVANGRIHDLGKSEAARRTVRLSRLASEAISGIPRPLRPSVLVWGGKQGRPLDLDNWRKRVWNGAIERSSLEHRPLYQMRHTYATLALAQGVPIEWISKQMGHTDIRVTLKHYARFIKKADDRYVSLLDQIGEEDEADTRRAE